MQGPLKDRDFEFIPGTLTTWKDWKTKHSDTSVINLSRTASRYGRDLLDENFPVGYGIKLGQSTAAYAYRHLNEHPVYQDQLAGQNVVIVFDAKSTRTFAYQSKVDETNLTFETSLQDGFLVDETSQTKWDPWSGEAVDGPWKGKRLQTVYGLITYMEAWKRFYPEGKLVQ